MVVISNRNQIICQPHLPHVVITSDHKNDRYDTITWKTVIFKIQETGLRLKMYVA